MTKINRFSVVCALMALAMAMTACVSNPADSENRNGAVVGKLSTPETAVKQPSQRDASTGTLKIATRPAGASVILIIEDESGADEPQSRGITPISITDLSPGKYTVSLELKGFKSYQKSVDVKAGETTPIVTDLQKK